MQSVILAYQVLIARGRLETYGPITVSAALRLQHMDTPTRSWSPHPKILRSPAFGIGRRRHHH
jgi:hypothetical protein